MKTAKFGQHLERLLWTGAIEGKKVLNLHHLLRACKQGMISTEASSKRLISMIQTM
ncbi:MAG TPA: hypothetical protein V6C65_10185 [Allocoleopsis sp.]